MVRRFNRYRSRRRYTKRRFQRSYSRPTKTFRKKVQRVLYRTAETKYNTANFAGTFTSDVNWWGSPDIVAGAARNQRIGNKIWARWLTFDILIMHQATQGANNDTWMYHTVRLVWPKDFSNAEAVSHLTLGEFPVYSARNEENWILIKEWKFSTHNTEPANPQDYSGSTTMKRIKFSWAMNRKLNYESATDTTPQKQFYLVWSSAVIKGNRVDANIQLQGTFRISYKDI